MKGKVRRLVNLRFDRYQEMEMKLEKLAAEGLFLEECGIFWWTFRRGEPKHLHYTVTYFPEGSLFQPGITDHQQTYFEYAEAAGWRFVAERNQMQIFCNEAENPIPFETDERGKLENIKACMKKSFLPSTILMIVVFLFNLGVQFHSFQRDPIGFLSSSERLFSFAMIVAAVLYFIYSLVDYLLWCGRSARSIAAGGVCANNAGQARRVFDVAFLCGMLGGLGWFLLHTLWKGSWFGLIGFVQFPILMLLFGGCIRYLKKKKAAALWNRVISYTVLLLASFGYVALVVLLVVTFDFPTGGEADYRVVNWELTPTETRAYKLYRDELPLTCEDLYGQIDYDYYSYEENTDSAIFLTRRSYRQDVLPAKDAPPRLAYERLEPQFRFVYALAREQLLSIPEWRPNARYQPIDNALFGTEEAYQRCYDYGPTGTYVLFYEDDILTLELEEPPTPAQAATIQEKLSLPR